MAICLLLTISSAVFAQGMPRPNGLGFRLSFWKMVDSETLFRVNQQGLQQTVSLDGLGFWLQYYNRIHDNLSLSFDFGTVSRIHVTSDGTIDNSVDVNGIFAFLPGIRYDLLSRRLTSKFQPYLDGGLGPYFQQSVNVENYGTDSFINDNSNVNTEGRYDMGAYLGGGFNLPVSSRFALNFDLKYHFVDFAVNKDISGIEFGIGLSYMWGKMRDLFRVRQTTLVVHDIYPAYYQFYNTYPLAIVSVENTAGYPIEVNVRSRVSPYSARPKDSGFITLVKGETKDIPATAVFNPNISQVDTRKPAVLDIEVEGRAGVTHKEDITAQIVVHSRNSWNGEMDKLSYFVTPDDSEIIQLSRKIANREDDSTAAEPEKLHAARDIFNELDSMDIRYQSDPNIPFYRDDRVQFADETLRLGSGDCDDLVVLYASLLESLGINTAFVEVQDPEKTIAHVYLLFDSGVPAVQAQLVSSNEKRYLLREDSPGNSSIWIPVETTLIGRGFEEAWSNGALNYLQEALIRNGLAEGWVRIFDVD
ncbi:MAG: transglutaminase-like domain-containing protein [Calditrichia bacterium]